MEVCTVIKLKGNGCGDRRKSEQGTTKRKSDVTSPLNDPTLEALLDRLHAQSDIQVEETDDYFSRRLREGTLDFGNLTTTTCISSFQTKWSRLIEIKESFATNYAVP